jgi:iron complex transport system substrate-binding protein
VVDLGSMVGRRDAAQALVAGYIERIEAVQRRTAGRSHRPRIYFEEWDDPMICGIQWVSELIEIAGGRDVFGDKARGRHASDRKLSEDDVVAAAPDLMLACWCGKALDRESVRKRARVRDVPAWANDRIVELPPEIILQPGPACLTDGLDRLEAVIHEEWDRAERDPA